MTISELEALMALSSIPYLGPVKIRLLLKNFGSAQEALAAEPSMIAKLPNLGSKVVSSWKEWHQNQQWRHELDLAEKAGVRIIPYTSPEYPKRLKDIPDAPILLYVKGQILPTDERSIAVVGTRYASNYGNEMAELISHELVAAGFTVVSGLAKGIDTAAHRGALRQGRTLAVLGSGLANVYPHENISLGQAIIEQGALISEFPMQTAPDRQNFPQRNGTVSGMTMGTLLVEAPLESGAMITMKKAREFQRPLFALPGRTDMETFRGNHYLIKSGQATLVENANDIIDTFNDLFGLQEQTSLQQRNPLLAKEEKDFLSLLPNKELSLDEIHQITRLPISKINIMLMGLQLKNVVKEFPGNLYKKNH